VLADAAARLFGIGAVVVVLAVVTMAAVTWARHGFFPTKGPMAGLAPKFPPIRRVFERWNREAGWGDTGDDEPSHGPGDHPKE
jgi:hypothetical protein